MLAIPQIFPYLQRTSLSIWVEVRLLFLLERSTSGAVLLLIVKSRTAVSARSGFVMRFRAVHIWAH